MPNLTKDNPARIKRDLAICNLRANGDTHRDIAKKTGISYPRVSQILSDKQCQAIVQNAIRIQIAHAHGAIKEHIRICYDRKHTKQLDAIIQLEKNIGIAKDHTGNLVLQQIFQQVNIGALTPQAIEFMQFLRTQGAPGPAPALIDVTPDNIQDVVSNDGAK